MIAPTFAQLDALATAPAVDAQEHARYLEHQKFCEVYGDCRDACRCQDGDEALFCLAPHHHRPWWAP